VAVEERQDLLDGRISIPAFREELLCVVPKQLALVGRIVLDNGTRCGIKAPPQAIYRRMPNAQLSGSGLRNALSSKTESNFSRSRKSCAR
jgi:hypothetical protein